MGKVERTAQLKGKVVEAIRAQSRIRLKIQQRRQGMIQAPGASGVSNRTAKLFSKNQFVGMPTVTTPVDIEEEDDELLGFVEAGNSFVPEAYLMRPNVVNLKPFFSRKGRFWGCSKRHLVAG
jgi:hypothetical protein